MVVSPFSMSVPEINCQVPRSWLLLLVSFLQENDKSKTNKNSKLDFIIFVFWDFLSKNTN